jgi:hypothetical protein
MLGNKYNGTFKIIVHQKGFRYENPALLGEKCVLCLKKIIMDLHKLSFILPVQNPFQLKDNSGIK